MLNIRPRDAARLHPNPIMSFPDEDDFHRLLDALTTCVLLHDAQTRAIVWANRAACIALGFSVEELLPLKAPDMTRPEPKYRREIAVSAWDRALVDGPQVYDCCYRSRTGVDMLSEATATYVPLRGRDVVMVQFRDISAEEAVRQQLRRYEARLREFMQDLDEGIAVVTPHGGVQFISESGRRVLGLAPDEALGEVLDYCSEADRDRLVAQLRDAPSAYPSAPQRYRIVRRDGSPCWLRILCRQVEIEGDLDGLLVQFRDVSDERVRNYLMVYRSIGYGAVVAGAALAFLAGKARGGDSRFRMATLALAFSLVGVVLLLAVGLGVGQALILVAALPILVGAALMTRPSVRTWYDRAPQGKELP